MLLMEKTRVGRRSGSDQTYHVLSRLIIGAEGLLQKELGLDRVAFENSNPFITISQKLEEKQKAATEFTRLVAAFDVLNIEASAVKAIWMVLASIVHLGNAGVAKGAIRMAQNAVRMRPQITIFPGLFQLAVAAAHASSSPTRWPHKRQPTCWAFQWKI